MEFPPEQLRNLSGTPLVATIVWLALIPMIPITILLVKPIKLLLNKFQKSDQDLLKKNKKTNSAQNVVKDSPKGF
tara:strand:+ start:766 stop:990 length:225 start_codon:yes stop_codon:yes gene_type:complete